MMIYLMPTNKSRKAEYLMKRVFRGKILLLAGMLAFGQFPFTLPAIEIKEEKNAILDMPAKATKLDYQQASSLFSRANQDYKNKLHEEAILGYTELIKAGYGNGHVYFNLGNAYYRSGKIGLAALNYKRAKLYLPRDPDLDYNLRFVNKKIIDLVSANRDFFSILFFWLDAITLREALIIFIAVNLIFFTFLSLRIFIRRERVFYGLVFFFIAWLITGLALGRKWYLVTNYNYAVVIAEEAQVHSGPYKKETVLFKVHQGTTVLFHEKEDNWSLVSLPDKKRGWISSDRIEKIVNED